MQRISLNILSFLVDKTWSRKIQYEDKPPNSNCSYSPFLNIMWDFIAPFSHSIALTLLFIHLISHLMKTIFYQVLGEVDL